MTEQFEMAEHTIVIERELDAPRELVWKTWTDADEVTRWWGPEHFTTPRDKIEFDLRPGGVCRLTMVGPDGEEYPSDGHFGIVEPPERLSFGEESSEHPMIESGETTVELIDLGESRTKVVITSRMICAEQLIGMAQAGWGSQLGKLVALLAS
ncbi:MAG: SRPBCC domain-containing protein [Solirubrobacteraceae bacterium]